MYNFKVALLILSILIDRSFAYQRLRRGGQGKSRKFPSSHTSSNMTDGDNTEEEKQIREKHVWNHIPIRVMDNNEKERKNKINENKDSNVNKTIENAESKNNISIMETRRQENNNSEDRTDDDGENIAPQDALYEALMEETGILPVVLDNSHENRNEDRDKDGDAGAENATSKQNDDLVELGDDNNYNNGFDDITDKMTNNEGSIFSSGADAKEDVEKTSSPTNAPSQKATEWPTAAIKTDSPTAKHSTILPTGPPTMSPITYPTKKEAVQTATKRGNGGNKEIKNKEDNDSISLSTSSSPTKSPLRPPTPNPSLKPKLNQTPSPTTIKDPSEIYDNLSEEEKEYIKHNEKIDEEKEAAKISLGFILLTLSLMICTAYQMGENPDGVYANVCRLAITIISCVFKMILYPFRKVLGLNNNSGYAHHLVTTRDFADPYSRSNQMHQFL